MLGTEWISLSLKSEISEGVGGEEGRFSGALAFRVEECAQPELVAIVKGDGGLVSQVHH